MARLLSKENWLLVLLLEVVAVGISVWIMWLVAQHGESHWMEGIQLLAVYVILGRAFYWLPTAPTAAPTPGAIPAHR